MQAAFSCLFWAFLVVTSLLLFPVAVLTWAITAPFDRRKVILHRFTCFWASLYTWFNPAWPLRIEGREKIDRKEAYVMVSNHLSLLDILVMFRLFTHFKWVSKIENFRVPFIGWNMSFNGYVRLKRGDRSSVVEMMRNCDRVLAAGNSIMMFPEGTRSPTGRIRSFKTGAFELAVRNKRPLLPIVLLGTADALPKRGFVLRGRHPLKITVLDPIPFEQFESASVPDLTTQVHDLIAEHVAKAQAAPPA